MKIFRVTMVIAGLVLTIPAWSQSSTAKGLFQADVADVSNQEIVVVEVTYPAGVESSVHRHNAHTVVYVLEGTVIMQVEGGEAKTLTVGEMFYETPADIHTVSMNASKTKPARILVYFLKEKDAPASVPAS